VLLLFIFLTAEIDTKHQQKSDKLYFVGGHGLFAHILTALLLTGKKIAYYFIKSCFDWDYDHFSTVAFGNTQITS